MTTRITMLSPVNGGQGLGVMTAAGSPYTVADSLAFELVNRGVAQFADPQVPATAYATFISYMTAAQFAQLSAQVSAGVSGEIYEVIDSAGRPQYRWNGSTFVLIGSGGVGGSSTPGAIPTVTNNVGKTLTVADSQAVQQSASPGPLIFRLPLSYTLGRTRVAGTTPELAYLVQRGYTGTITINPANYRGEVASQAAMVALAQAVAGDWCQRTDQSGAGSRGGQVFVLTADPFSAAGNWTALGMTLANRPNIAWGIVANNAAMQALANAIPGDFCTKTDAGGATYQLVALPASTVGNWIQRTDADKPVDPSIKVYLNVDPALLPIGGMAQCSSFSIGNDVWVVG